MGRLIKSINSIKDSNLSFYQTLHYFEQYGEFHTFVFRVSDRYLLRLLNSLSIGKAGFSNKK